jgi:hypothetical protein
MDAAFDDRALLQGVDLVSAKPEGLDHLGLVGRLAGNLDATPVGLEAQPFTLPRPTAQ